MSGFTLRGRLVALLLAALAVLVCAPGAAHATTSETTVVQQPHDGPVYLILSLEEEFDTPDLSGGNGEVVKSSSYQYPTGSETVIIEIGEYIAGEEIGETRFDPKSSLADIELPEGIDFEDLDGYQITILGAFDTYGPNTVHLVTPSPGEEEDPIPPAVQEAFFLAAPFLDEIGEELETMFPTTVEIAQYIFDVAVEQNEALAEQTSPQEILDYIFVTEASLEAPEDAAFAEADGDLFPHDPDDDDPLFEFSLKIDPDTGEVSLDVCLTVEIDILPCCKKNFVWIDRFYALLPVLVFGSDDFAVDEIDRDTVALGGVEAKCTFIKDFNCDGNKDLLAFFCVGALVKQGALGKKTKALDLTADLTDGGCIIGTDSVKPKWRKKWKWWKKKKCW